MEVSIQFFALLLLVSLLPMRETAAQEETTQEDAILKLQELGFIRDYAIDDDGFFDQIKAGNLEVVKLFLAVGVNPDVRDMQDMWQRNALLVAAEEGQAEIVKALVEAGADVGVKDKVGRTPLVVAVQREHDAVVGVLLNRQE